MRRPLAALAAVALLCGCSASTSDEDEPNPGPRSYNELQLGWGVMGPAKLGMSKKQALATGVFVEQPYVKSAGCKASALRTKPRFKNLEVRTTPFGRITSFRAVGPGPETANGRHIGDYWGTLHDFYGTALSTPQPVGDDKSGAYAHKKDVWIGFLLDGPADDYSDAEVTLIEVVKGGKPKLDDDC